MNDRRRARREVSRPDVTLRYDAYGIPGGHPVLLLHGYSDSSYSFSRILPHLPATWFVIVPDQRGHGDSGRPEHGYEVEDFAFDAAGLLDELNIEGADVVGHSFGSLVAQRMAALFPGKVRSFALIGAISRIDTAEIQPSGPGR
jgi:non-heme chloroperoxidase